MQSRQMLQGTNQIVIRQHMPRHLPLQHGHISLLLSVSGMRLVRFLVTLEILLPGQVLTLRCCCNLLLP